MGATEAWDGLAPPWRVAFGEAWRSFCADNFGIGAVLVDPAVEPVDPAVDAGLDPVAGVVAVGRNRVAQREHEPRTLSGNMTAHAEMNAFAALDRFNAEGLHLFTTLQPCLMCAGAAMQLKVAHVHFAAYDEFFIGLDELWPHHPLTAERQPASTGPLSPMFARFARLLPMAFTMQHLAGRLADQLVRAHHPDLVAVVERLADDDVFTSIKRDGTVDDAICHLVEVAGL
jgi:tRNA(Arg) A34 adenosine deaminase TadA